MLKLMQTRAKLLPLTVYQGLLKRSALLLGTLQAVHGDFENNLFYSKHTEAHG